MRSGEPNRRSPLMNIATDVHFWIPVLVLIAGLVLLHSIH
jgi:hypothetical protein